MASRKGKPKPRQQRSGGKAAGLLKEIARRRPDITPDPAAAEQAREVLAQALPYLNTAPLFFDTAMKVGIVPKPPAVFTQPTTALPTIQRRSLLGLDDNQEGQDR